MTAATSAPAQTILRVFPCIQRVGEIPSASITPCIGGITSPAVAWLGPNGSGIFRFADTGESGDELLDTMDTPKRGDSFGIWTLMICALGCATFTFRGIIALADRQERTEEGLLFLTAGLIASLIVAQMIWRLVREQKQAV